MVLLVEVIAELLRSLGYQARLQTVIQGVTGRDWLVPLLAEKDARRVALTLWLDAQPLTTEVVDTWVDCVKDTGSDAGVILSLGPTTDNLTTRALRSRVQVWNSERIASELGSAVLRETCSNLWIQSDPLLPLQPGRILNQLLEAQERQAPPNPTPAPAPSPPPSPPALEPPVTQAPTGQLQLPLAFGVLDQAMAEPNAAATLPPAAAEPLLVPVMTAPAPAPTQTLPPLATTPTPPPKPARLVLRTQVSKTLAVNLVKNKIRTVDRVHLRLVPYYVFDYEAQLLVDGSLNTEKRQGRLGVDASTKHVRPWAQPLDTGDLSAEGTDVDEKRVRLADEEAQKIVLEELKQLVTRDVLMQEDETEWSVTVKKKVQLADNEVRLMPLGLFWLPIWRITGKDGSMEIDASTGQIVFEEILQSRSDALLI